VSFLLVFAFRCSGINPTVLTTVSECYELLTCVVNCSAWLAPSNYTYLYDTAHTEPHLSNRSRLLTEITYFNLLVHASNGFSNTACLSERSVPFQHMF
jgi:hypothetical protein